MKYLKGCICLMLLAMFAVGCTHTAHTSRVDRINYVFDEDIPKSEQAEILKSLPDTRATEVLEAGDNSRVSFSFFKKGKPKEINEKNSIIMNAETRQAATRKVVGGVGSKGADAFVSSVQGYYGRKTQGAASFDNGSQIQTQTNTQTNTQNN